MINILGLFTLVNVIWALGTFMIVGALSYIVILYVLPVLLFVPAEVIEMSLYAADFAIFYVAYQLLLSDPHTYSPTFLAFLGCLGIPCLYALTLTLHFRTENNNVLLAAKAGFWLCTIAWSIVAVHFSSQMIAMIAVAAFFGALGFVFLSTPFCYLIGFAEKAAIPRTMTAAFYLITAYVYVATHPNLFDDKPPQHAVVWEVFRPAVLGLGTFVYSLGWLIVSNRLYHGEKGVSENPSHYIWTNVLACANGLAAIALGSVFVELSLLKAVGGTFFGFFALEKFLEFPWDKTGYVFMMLSLGIMLYMLAWFFSDHPEYILSFA